MNLPEELCHWYLRLNGFFPIDRFVMHRTAHRMHPSDCDVLAIRPPHVYEDIGGTPEDWDPALTDLLDFTRLVGVICEVKGGKDIERDTLFVHEWVSYAVARLGFISREETTDVVSTLVEVPKLQLGDGLQIAKLLVSKRSREDRRYLSFTLDHMESFIRARMRKYQKNKQRDRYFFDSILIQQLILEEGRAEFEENPRLPHARGAQR